MTFERWVTSLGDSMLDVSRRVGEQLPGVFAAIALVALGWVVAWIVRFLAVRLVARITRLVTNRALNSEMRKAGIVDFVPKLVGGFAFWVILLFFLAAASEVLGLAVVTGGVSRLALFLPDILAAALVVAAGLVAANLARAAVVSASTSANIAHGELVGRALRVAILLVTVVVALDQVGIDGGVLHLLIYLTVGATLGGAALAFGLGARGVVGNLLSLHYVLQTYRLGQTIRVGEYQGRIVEFTSTGVAIDSVDGRVLVPGREFSQTASWLLDEGRRA